VAKQNGVGASRGSTGRPAVRNKTISSTRCTQGESERRRELGQRGQHESDVCGRFRPSYSGSIQMLANTTGGLREWTTARIIDLTRLVARRTGPPRLATPSVDENHHAPMGGT